MAKREIKKQNRRVPSHQSESKARTLENCSRKGITKISYAIEQTRQNECYRIVSRVKADHRERDTQKLLILSERWLPMHIHGQEIPRMWAVWWPVKPTTVTACFRKIWMIHAPSSSQLPSPSCPFSKNDRFTSQSHLLLCFLTLSYAQ